MTHQRRHLLVIMIAYAGFIGLGLSTGLLGVAWPSIQAFFGLQIDAVGALLIASTVGYVLASGYSGRLLGLFGAGTLLMLSSAGAALGLLGAALTPFWWLLVALSLLTGAGGGAIDAALNTYVATHYSTRTLNWLHACFGIGATLGPWLMTSVLRASLPWQWGYLLAGVVQLGLVLCFALTRRWWQASGAVRTSTAGAANSAPGISTLRLPIVWLSIAIFFLYAGIEIGAGQWAFSLFTLARAIDVATAGLWVGIYWGSLTVGRILFGVIVSFVPVRLALRLCLLSMVLGAGLLWLNLSATLSFLGLAVLGFAQAPIFPSLIAATPEHVAPAHTANVVGFQVAAAALGASLLPSLIGVLAKSSSVEVVGPLLTLSALLLLPLYEVLVANRLPAERGEQLA